jgi:hypothetical protein
MTELKLAPLADDKTVKPTVELRASVRASRFAHKCTSARSRASSRGSCPYNASAKFVSPAWAMRCAYRRSRSAPCTTL